MALHGDPVVAEFQRWMVTNRYPRTKLALTVFEKTGRGLVATEDIHKGEVLVAIPKRFLLNTQSALESDIGHIIKKHNELHPLQTLSLHILRERQKQRDSFWFPYFRMLPESFNTTALFLDSELPHLQNGQLIQDTKSDRHEMTTKYQSLIKIIEKYPKVFGDVHDPHSMYSYSNFQWAWMVIQTRSCFMELDKAKNDNCVVVPFADMLNHSNSVNSEAAYNETTQSYEIRTLTEFKKGEEVYICYGNHGNAQLMRYYGFTARPNPDDSVIVNLDSYSFINQAGDPDALETKIAILSQNNILGNYELYKGDIPWNFLTAVRIYMMNDEEMTDSGHERALMDEMISERNEKTTHKFIMELMELMLQSYPTTIQEDEEALQRQSNISYNVRNAIIVRLSLKEVMMSIWNLCYDKLMQLQDG
eukprot:TRINITY_DN2426_c0_g1_i2.p1 TRINITY_DN2426_c0_g1~~TRINITY_DN2426_c0_g1_i2.p1  ORF type:complete len:419 (+),score=87.50 TRINITY_DN2426_c0_g1_i2:64-1320(+)